MQRALRCVPPESVRSRKPRPGFRTRANGRRGRGRFPRNAHRRDGRRFAPQRLPGWLLRAVQVHHAVHALPHYARAAVADMGPVIVVVEENQAGNVIPFTKYLVVIAQNFDAPRVALGTLRRTRAIAIFGNYDRLIWKCAADLVQIAAGIGGRSAVPALVVFVPHDVVHQARDVLLRSLLQRVGGVGNQPARIQALGLFVIRLVKA
jgi:hypothetical protein